ncbi:unnamed protein product [Dicrocoelium dendriticum]|nr:unnamed protein product [Dicrocoelium dendriticum]
MSLPSTPGGPGAVFGGAVGPLGFKKRTKVVFLSPAEITNWNRLEDCTEQKLIDQSDILKYEELLKNSSPSVSKCVSDTQGPPPKKRGRPKGSKNGMRKKPIDPSQPWLEGNESDDVDAGLEGELDDDEYFRRLEEEKLREDEEEALRKKRAAQARLALRKKSTGSTRNRSSTRRPGRSSSSVNYAAMAGITETSDSDGLSEYGEGTVSSIGGSRVGPDDIESTRELYPHDQEEEPDELSYEPGFTRELSPTESLPGSRHPSEERDFVGTEGDETFRLDPSRSTSDPMISMTPTDPFTIAMLNVDPIQLLYQSPCLSLPPSATDLVCPSRLLLDAFSVYEILIRYGRLLRLSPFRIEDFLAALVANENSTLLSEIHIALLKSIIREDDAAGTLMYSADCKDSVSITLYSIDRFTWPYLLAAYLNSIKSSEANAQVAASGLGALSMAAAYAAGAAGCGPTGGGGADTVLTAALFPSDSIPLDPAYPLVSVDRRLAVLSGLTNLLLATGPVRGDVLRDGFLPHEDHCRFCHLSGDLLCCDGCTAVYHLRCLQPPLSVAPASNWLCPACVKDQTVGVTDCQSEAERAGKVHRREPLGTDRAGRVYWYIGRRLVVEPVCYAQKEPHLLNLSDGKFDPSWPEKHFARLLQTDELEPLPQWTGDGDADHQPDDASPTHSTSLLDYNGEPPVYYYSSFEQVTELRHRLCPRWEPWLCQRLDTLLPRMMSEMSHTQLLTAKGLELFCQIEPNCNVISSSNPSLSHNQRNVFSLLELETARSKSRMASGSNATDRSISQCPVVCAFEAVSKGPWYSGNFPAGIPVTDNDDESDCGVLVAPDEASCLVRNQDAVVTRVPRSEDTDTKTPTTVLAEVDLMSLSTPLFNSDYFNTTDTATRVAYRLSDEGLWRSWNNTYSVGFVADTKQQSMGNSSKSHSTSRKQPDDQVSSSDDNHAASGVSGNLALTRAQFMEEKERKRLLGNKFSLSDLATDLWQYLEPPIVHDHLTRFVAFLKIPWELDERPFSPSWSASFPRMLHVIRLTLSYFEAQIPLNFYLPAWRFYRKRWLRDVLHSKNSSDLASLLAQFEAAIRPVCFQRVWFNALGHITFERTTAAQREEDRRLRLMDRSGAGGNQSNASSISSNIIRTKTPRPVRHTVWKFRGEEYRRLGGDGWLWLSSTRRSPANEAELLSSIYPPLCSPVGTPSTVPESSLSRRMLNHRGLQHGIGWGVCPNYLQGQVPIKPPRPGECRGHVLHPITGIPLYLNPRRVPFIIPTDELRLIQSLAAPWEAVEASLSCSATPGHESKSQPKEDPVNSSPQISATEYPVSNSPVSSNGQKINSVKTETVNGMNSVSIGPSLTAVPELSSLDEPVVLNVSYCLRERVHFPPLPRRPTTSRAASRRLRFRLDDLLNKRQTVAETDKRNASAAEATMRSLEVELSEIEGRRSQLSERLVQLNADAQEARTAKAKAMKAKMAGDTEPSAVNRDSESGTTDQPHTNSSRQLIQHSVVTLENGPKFRVITSRLPNQPVYAPFIDQTSKRPCRQPPSRPKRKRSDDDDYSSDDNCGSNGGLQLRRSARRQRATRPDPDFVVDFDDEEEGSPDGSAADANSDCDSQSAFTDHEHYAVRGGGDHTQICRQLPQYDGVGDECSGDDDECTSPESDILSDSASAHPMGTFSDNSEDQMFEDVTLNASVFQRKPVFRPPVNVSTQSSLPSCTTSTAVNIQSAIDAKISTNSSASAACSNDASSTSSAVGVLTTSTSGSTDTLRLLFTSPTTQAQSQPTSTGSTLKCVSTTSAPIVFPRGVRLLPNVHPSSIISSPLRLLDGKIVRATPSLQPNITINRLPAFVTPISTVDSSAVRVIISSASSTDKSITSTSTAAPTVSSSFRDTSTAYTSTSDTSVSSIPSNTLSSVATRYQPAILRRTLATVSPAVGKPVASPTEFKFFTIPQSQSVATTVASSTARQVVCGDLTARLIGQPKTTPDADAPQSRRSLAKAEHVRNIPLVENRVAPLTASVLIAPRILPKPNGAVSTASPLRSPLSSSAQVTLEKAVQEASAQLKQIETEAISVKSELASMERKMVELRKELSRHSKLRFQGQPSTAQPYSLYRRNKDITSEVPDTVVLPSQLPPVNTYVWPPVNWPEDHRRRPSTSSLFRWDARNLRSLILAAGRRELSGYDVEKKRLAQVVWPYPSAKPTLSEAWRFRLSHLRLGPDRNGKKPSQLSKCSLDLANLALLLHTLWYCIRWDEMLMDPSEDNDHIMDAEGHPCLRELMDYVDSGSLKSGEPAYCTRKIVGVRPLDRFWQRVTYLVHLTHTVPSGNTKAKKSRTNSRASRGPDRGTISRRSAKSKASSGSDSPATSPQPRRRGKGGKASGQDPDYDPAHDEGWRVGVPCPNLTGRRRAFDRNRQRSGYDSEDDDTLGPGGDGDRQVTDSRGNKSKAKTNAEKSQRELHVEEQWMSEESFRLWEIRCFMDEFLPPNMDYLESLNSAPGNLDVPVLRRPFRLQTPASEVVPPSTDGMEPPPQHTNDITDFGVNTTGTTLDTHSKLPTCSTLVGALSGPQQFQRVSWVVEPDRRRLVVPDTKLAQSSDGIPPAPVRRRVRENISLEGGLQPENLDSPFVLDAKSKARSIAAMRAAKASVAARKLKAERILLDQRVRALRAQLVARKRLHLSWARLLAEVSSNLSSVHWLSLFFQVPSHLLDRRPKERGVCIVTCIPLVAICFGERHL